MSAAVSHWDTLVRRVVVRGRLVARTGLHIGDGGRSADPTALDDSVIRAPDGNPFIPGSSLKGAVRSFLERLAAARAGWLMGEHDGTCAHAMEQRDWDTWVREQAQGEADRIYAALCPACRLLGAPHYAGRLQVRDLPAVPGSGPGHWERPGHWRVRLGERNGVGIHRDTGTAASGVLYDFQVVPPGTAFALELLLENPADAEWHNALVALVALARGDIPLGGKVTRGLGAVALTEVQIWDLKPGDGSLRRYVLGTPLAELPAQTLDAAAAAAGLPGTAPARAPLARLRDALEGDGEVTWAEVQARLLAAFGGERDV